jgi:hypothetical protein
VALKNQGLTEKNIQLHLEATGASRQFAIDAAFEASRGQSADAIANKLLTTANYAAVNKDVTRSSGQVYDNTDYVVPREVGQVMTAEQQTLADSIPYRDMVKAGTISVDQAATYADAGYAPADVTKLMSVGYNATDLQDLATVGVNARDLVTLSDTKFAEGQINDLMSGGASVTDIATTSRAIDTGRIDVGTASQLLSRNISGTAITNLANRGQAQIAVNSTLSDSTIDRLASGNFDISRADALQKSGTNVDQLISENKWNEYNQLAAAKAPTTTATVTGPAAPVDPTAALVNSGTITAQQVSDLTQNGYSTSDIAELISKGYTAPDLFDLAAVGVPPRTLVSLANTQFPESQINDLMAAGASANDIASASNTVNAGRISVDTATKLLSKDFTGAQINNLAYGQPQNLDAVANSNISSTTYNQITNSGTRFEDVLRAQTAGLDINNAVSQNPNWQTAVAQYAATPPGTILVKDAAGNVSYFEAATGNTLDSSGRVITYARAPEVGQGTETAGTGDMNVQVSGIVGRVGNESSVRGPLSEGATLATQEDIDSGRAVVNDAANAWEVPNQYTYTTPPGEVVGPPAPVAPPNEYVYTTPPGEFVGPPTPPPVEPPPFVAPVGTTFYMPNGETVISRPTGTYTEQGGLVHPNPDWASNNGGTTTPPAIPTPVPPATEVVPTPLPPVSEPVVQPPAPDYTYTTPPGEVVGPPAPPVVAPPVTPPGYTYTTPPGETVGPPAPPATQPPLTPLVPGDSTPRPPVTNVDLTQPPPLTPLEPVEITPRPPIPEVVVQPPAPVTPPAGPAPVEVITPPTPYVPVPTPPVGEDPATKFKGWGPITPLMFGTAGQINNPGLNPGFIQPTPYYRTTSPVQSQYYYGQRPYQPGPTFNQALYNTVPNAPAVPFGLQQMYTPTDLNAYLSQFTAGPVAPR